MEKEVVVTLEDGINADVVSLLVQTACRFDSRLYLQEGERKVNMKSIMGMMNMAVNSGKAVTVIADGADAAEAVSQIEKVLTGK
ncbi:MAG: HPr family phosphocarrier protein [Lachnospiraceae bacterium]|nr:HPr family phosphocarrier protein [Lachnospiraceae bacterium]